MKIKFRFCGHSFYTTINPTGKSFKGVGVSTREVQSDQITSIRLAL